MNRIISILLISLLTVSVYAYEPEYPYSVISTLHYGAYGEAEQDDDSNNPYGNPYGGRTPSFNDTYRCSYHGEMKMDRISANTFSATPSMEITTMLPPEEEGSFYGFSSSIRPPQRDVGTGDGDVTEPGTNDPNATPLGDTPWVLMAILAGAFAIFSARKHRAEKRQ